MQTLTLHIPDGQLPLLMHELTKFKDIKIEVNNYTDSKEEINEGIRQAVREVNMIKQGKIKARPARELLDEL